MAALGAKWLPPLAAPQNSAGKDSEIIMFAHIPSVSGIYAIVNMRNGDRYVGQAADMNKRVRDHVRELDLGTHRTNRERRLQKAWKEFGREAFEIVVLEKVTDNNYPVWPDKLSLAEHFYINEQSEYNVDKHIVGNEFKPLVNAKAWRKPQGQC
jgi:group I intron endonuclease